MTVNIYPAVHITQFGVFPTVDADPNYVESLTALRATEHEIEAARRMPETEEEWDAIINDEKAALAFEEEREEVARISRLRIRNAYDFAAKQGWIKPIRGDVFLAEAIPMNEQVLQNLETAVISTFTEMFKGLAAPSLTLTVPVPDAEPAVKVAFVRCMVSGEVIPFDEFQSMPYMFKIMAGDTIEADLDPALFNPGLADTVAHCKANCRDARSLVLMGHGGMKPPKPGPRPA